MTLCNKSDEHSYNNLKCLNRECNECGVDKFVLLPEAVSVNSDEQVVWKHYAYVGTGKFLSNGQEKKKITLISKQTPPKELFKKIQELLKDYPYHSFMAKWQRDQMDNLIEYLPHNEAICIHDYSEGYSCRQQDELQSEYFDVAKVSLHITIPYRHAVESIDGKISTEEDPHIVKKHLFVISDDEVQDYHSAQSPRADHSIPERETTNEDQQASSQMDVLHNTSLCTALGISLVVLLTMDSKCREASSRLHMQKGSRMLQG